MHRETMKSPEASEDSTEPNGDPNLLEKFQKDALFGRFIHTDFKTSDNISSIIQESSIQDSIQKLSQGLAALDEDLHGQVAVHHEELLNQVSSLKDMENMLEVVSSGVRSLQNSVDRMATEIAHPSSVIKSRTLQLVRLLEACQLLRKVIRFLYLARKLQASIQTGEKELAKAASCVLELEMMRKEDDLSGIHIVDKEIQWIVKAGEDVMNNASRMLLQGLEIQNNADVAAALQVFYNLGSLKTKVDGTIDMLRDKAFKSIYNALGVPIATPTEPPKSTTSNTANDPNAAARGVLWTRIEKMIDILHACCVQIWHLQRVLTKLKDPNTHVCFVELLVKEQQPTLVQSFWKDLTQRLKDQLESAARGSNMIETTFVGEFPKLYRQLQEFLKRLQTHYEMKHGGSMTTEEETDLLNCLFSFKTSYLQRSFARLYEAINKVFLMNSIPSSEEVINIASIINVELEMSKTSSLSMASPSLEVYDLSVSVSKGVAKSLMFFANKIEPLIATDATAYQIPTSDTCSPSQLRNAKLFNVLYQLHSAVNNLLRSSTLPAVKMAILPALNQLYQLGQQIIVPVFEKVTVYLEHTLQQMHSENFGKHDIPPVEAQQCSAYMQTLQQQIRHLQGSLFSKFSGAWYNEAVEKLAVRLVNSFVRYLSLVRPFGEEGKLKATADMAQLEFAIAPIQTVSHLGKPYQVLRSLRPFIFRDTAEIPECPEVHVLPPSVVLHHLFSRASPSLQSPHVVQNWSLASYIVWLEQHTEEEICSLVKRTLDTYASHVNARGEKEFDPLYPVMSSLGPTLLKKWKSKNTA